jgi:hypothetical protein
MISSCLNGLPLFQFAIDVSAFLFDVLRVTSETEGALPELTDWAGLWFVSEILVQAYYSTSAPIAKDLVDAHKRGLEVEAILDKSQRTEK